MRATPYRLEEEKMAVILQQVVGAASRRPVLSGFFRRRAFTQFLSGGADEIRRRIAAVALGLGRAVVGGGKCLTFCPRYPRHMIQFSSVEDILANSQTEFWALELDQHEHVADPER